MHRRWTPDYLGRAILNQADIWVTADGRILKVADMDLTHVLNTLLFLERVANDLPIPKDDLQDTALYKEFQARLVDALADEVETTPLEAVKSAIIAGDKLLINYTDADGNETTERVVRPARLYPVSKAMTAWDYRRSEWRRFLLDRISKVEVV